MNRHWRISLLVLTLYGGGVAAQVGRGELLYQTYCNACHTEHVHWRDKSIVTDRESLTKEVVRWQLTGNLDWNLDDVEAVAQYLDLRYYGFSPAKR